MENKDLYRHKPKEVEAYLITNQNMRDLAEWCDGKVVAWGPDEQRLQITTNEGHTRFLRAGLYLVKDESGFQPMAKGSFESSFEKVE